MSGEWAAAREAGRLPTVESLTPAEQLTRVRDLVAGWDASETATFWPLVELAAALGVAPGVTRTNAPPVLDGLPEPGEVMCHHNRVDGVCTICGDAPLFPVGPLPPLSAVTATFVRHYQAAVAEGVPRGAKARRAAWQQLTNAEQYVYGAPDRTARLPRLKETT